MAVDRTPVLKRCRSLGMDPNNLPIDKNNIDVISKGSAQNYFDQTEKYRLITEKVDNSLYPDAK